eukprot:m.168075 g.168075  ORF g.168075 m.168075 type:complete len:64 (-) comp31490_c0_seq1:1176-1367(-)
MRVNNDELAFFRKEPHLRYHLLSPKHALTNQVVGLFGFCFFFEKKKSSKQSRKGTKPKTESDG